MNRRGDLPTLMILVIAVLLSGMALFTFITFGGDFSKKSSEFSVLVMTSEFVDDYVIAQAGSIANEVIDSGSDDLEGKFKSVAKERDLNLEITGNFFAQVRNSKFSFIRNAEGYLLDIDGLFVKAKSGDSEIVSNFDLAMQFDLDGNLKQRFIS